MLEDNRAVAADLADRASAETWLESRRCSVIDGCSSPSTCGLFCHKSCKYPKNVAGSICYHFGLETGSHIAVRGWAKTALTDLAVA